MKGCGKLKTDCGKITKKVEKAYNRKRRDGYDTPIKMYFK